jgi:hypothetical protein
MEINDLVTIMVNAGFPAAAFVLLFKHYSAFMNKFTDHIIDRFEEKICKLVDQTSVQYTELSNAINKLSATLDKMDDKINRLEDEIKKGD